ncbi:DUF5107 domain-containing protein [Bacteroidota bacterium]
MRSFFTILITLLCLQGFTQKIQPVKVWEEPLTLPTYLVEDPDVNPMFFNNRSYQGASRVIYPYAQQDNITNVKENRTYKALYLENEYIKLCVLPEIGGRLFYATDKTNGYEIFYRQHVIKPANIGMLGAWISGGIEFCVFHHHRASTFIPVDYKLTQNEDGSATIWIGETEPRHRMKWTLGISLYPGKSFVEVDGRLINPTENINSILYWANVATHVNNDYQTTFPPSTDFAVFHAKNSFSHWPVTTEPYEGRDYYRDNIDASWWKNHPQPVSFFAFNIKEGFLAGYDFGKKAGTMHVGNQHIVAGAKLWEWGPGPYGSMWDSKVLTDSDGPYAELMAGAYSDNQPDYSWIKPYEYKTFKQYWYPIRETEGATSANLFGMVNLKQLDNNQVLIAANVTAYQEEAFIDLLDGNTTIFNQQIAISPGKPFSKKIKLSPGTDFTNLRLTLSTGAGEESVTYTPIVKKTNLSLPEEVKPPLPPEEIESLEELYLAGLRIKQFHNARIDPVIYFQEALKRDPLDSRCNNQMGLVYKHNGQYEKAAAHFRKALYRLTKDYTRPRNCEPFYHLGLVLKIQGNLEAAYDTLYRAAWDQAFASAAYYQLAQISCSRENFEVALEEVNRSLTFNNSNLNAYSLKSAILRTLENKEGAMEISDYVLSLDILNAMAQNERYLASTNQDDLKELKRLLRDKPESYLELAATYLNAGLLGEAKNILTLAEESENKNLNSYPTIYYYLGYIYHKLKETDNAGKYFDMGESLSTDYCFPFRMESEAIFKTVLEYNPQSSRAYYYLGNLLYDKQPERSIAYWEKAVQFESDLAIAHRNIGWGFNQTYNDVNKAIAAYEAAIENDNTDPIYYYELDKLYEQNGTQLAKRYDLLTGNHKYLSKRKDALLQEIKVLILHGDLDKAMDYLTDNFFPRQEGVDQLHDIYVDTWLLKGIDAMNEKDYASALKSFQNADSYPENHQIGRDDDYERNAQIFYYQGLAIEKDGGKKEASVIFEKAVEVKTISPEYAYYSAIALEKLGKKTESEQKLDELLKTGEKLSSGEIDVDFFSKFGEGQSENFLKADGNYLMGLAYLGRGKTASAKKYLAEAKSLNPNHLWAREILKGL